MAKIIDIDEQTAKKYARRMTADIIVTYVLMIVFLFIPMDGDCIVIKMINEIRDKDEITMEVMKYGCLVLFACVAPVSGVKAICKKNKSSINGGTPTDLPDSPFGEFSQEYGVVGFELFLYVLCVILFLYVWTGAEIGGALIITAVYVLKNLLFGKVLGISSVQKTMASLRIAKDEQKVQDGIKASEKETEADTNSEKRAYHENEPSTISVKDRKANLDALLKYKKLYDDGAITEEEYNAKKEELLK